MPQSYSYLVMYKARDFSDAIITGDSTLSIPHKITCGDDVDEIRIAIEKRNQLTDVVFTNIIALPI